MKRERGTSCVNFRDVGETVNRIANRALLPENRILRGGKIGRVKSLSEIGRPETIVNLRKGRDRPLFPVTYRHFPIPGDSKKYQTKRRKVRRWLNRVVSALADEEVQFPILFHCTSGKDRTGVVVAALLVILKIPRDVIVEEYLWSDGKVSREEIEAAIDGIGDATDYFTHVDLEKLRQIVLGREPRHYNKRTLAEVKSERTVIRASWRA